MTAFIFNNKPRNDELLIYTSFFKGIDALEVVLLEYFLWVISCEIFAHSTKGFTSFSLNFFLEYVLNEEFFFLKN